jgi:hypothetical protein
MKRQKMKKIDYLNRRKQAIKMFGDVKRLVGMPTMDILTAWEGRQPYSVRDLVRLGAARIDGSRPFDYTK